MENKTDLVGVGIKDKSKHEALNHQEIFVQLFWGIASYVIAAGNMLEGLSPFGAALAAASPERLLLATAIGAVGGSLIPSGVILSMKYAAAIMITVVARWAFFDKKFIKYQVEAAPIMAGVSMLLPSLAAIAVENVKMQDIAMSLSEALLAAGAAYFFARSFETMRQGWNIWRKADLACVIISLSIILLSLSAFKIWTLTAGRIAASLAIMICAALAGESAGTVIGSSCGIAISLTEFPNLSSIGIFSVSGLLSGVFSPLGKLATAVSFVLTNGIYTMLLYPPKEALPYLWEGAVASVIFMIIPLKKLQSLKIKTFRKIDQKEVAGMRELLLAKIDDAAIALKEIAGTTREVSEKLNKLKANSIEEIYQTAIDNVCRKCNRNISCWQVQFSDSMNCFNSFTEILRKNGKITEEDFIYPLKSQCKRKEKILEIINSKYEVFLDKEVMRRKVAQVRAVVTDQFEGMAEMLKGFGEEMLQISTSDRKLNAKVQNYLEELDIEAESVSTYRNEDEILFIQMLLPQIKLARIDLEEMAENLGEICSCELEQPEKLEIGGKIRLTFKKLAEYTMEFAYTQHICNGSRVCGDSCGTFMDRKSAAHMIISDGMGSGSGAAVDSTMTVTLLRRLLEANVEYDPALKIVNSALLVKTGEESIATIDAAAIDLYTGRAKFYKAGAAPSFVRRNKRTGYIDSTSLPIGILNAISFEKSTLQLSAGDIIVMMSDGATESGVEWIRQTIDRFNEEDGLQSLCDDLTTTARLKRNDCRDDDITVVAGILKKR